MGVVSSILGVAFILVGVVLAVFVERKGNMSWNLRSVYASLPYTLRGTAMVINGDPKGNNMLYCNGKAVIIRDISNPSIADTYTQHSCQATVAQYAPSGYYIASGDASGKIRIWDTVNKEHILKYEYQPFAGAVKDICWSPDNKRLVAVGQGREKFGACFLWDTGTSVGSISGHTKAINSVTYKPTRPFRIATASEDYTCVFHEGPPFKFNHSMEEHSNFVNCIRYSPDGNLLCSCGSDRVAVLYDGKTGEKLSKLGGDKAHEGGIYSVSWSPDSHHVLTASGDKSCKLWDVTTQQLISQFKIGSNIEDQQVGSLWQNDWMLSVSLSGNINYLDKNNPDKPIRILTGQNKNLTSMTTSCDSSTLYCGSMDGRVISHWNTESGEVGLVGGAGHTSLVCSMAATPEVLYSVGFDKTMKQTSTESNQFLSETFGIPDRDPTDIVCSSNGLQLIVTLHELILVRDGKKTCSLPVSSESFCASFHPNEPVVAVGFRDSKVIVYSVEGDILNQVQEIDIKGEVNTLAYDPSGDKLAVSGSHKPVYIYETISYKLISELLKHTARVNSLSWSPNGKLIASGGVDSNVCIYDMKTEKAIEIKGAHPMDVVTNVTWIDDVTVASCGNDCTIRVWQCST